MKKFITLIVILTLVFILGIGFVCLGIPGVKQEICISIGTGLITSTIVSIILEIISYVNERRLIKKASNLFLKQYRKAFFDLKFDLPRLYNETLFDDQKLKFSDYIDRLFDATYNDTIDTSDAIADIEFYVERIKIALGTLISSEKDVMSNEVIYSKFDLIKEQYETCLRLLGSIKSGAYEKTKLYATKLKDRHLEIFPQFKDAFEECYSDED